MPSPGHRNRYTPVFSTALPPRGLSGALRRAAHLIADHRIGHFALLLVADRIDVIEHLGIVTKMQKMRPHSG